MSLAYSIVDSLWLRNQGNGPEKFFYYSREVVAFYPNIIYNRIHTNKRSYSREA